MNNKNYRMPFDPGSLIGENGTMPLCSVAESIAQHLMLLITTRKNENRYDLDYGNAVWDIEFDNAITAVEWEKIFVESMKKQIADYEPRITSPKISLHIDYVEYSYDTKKFCEIKKKVKIAINAKLVETDELFSFATELYLSPMSID
ncbi:MAG: GPW/gp25 family protein [Chitinophagaceae bacterium]|jgi:phage baseplate assembly protein W|nr:GPW/gp25 family protein [Chitinophagaceae bacterium]